MPLPTLQLLSNQSEEMELIMRFIRATAHHDPIKILEAGCGTWRYLELDDIPHHLTGVDLDEEALALRKKKFNDIHDYIVGDLETVALAPASYDAIYNSFVLEHIEHADKVLENFVRWVKPGGVIVVRVPDPYSAHGFVTKVTPHWFHVLYYRYALNQKNAGKPGYAPYPTYYHPVISRQGMRDFCSKHNIELAVETGEKYYKPGKGLIKQLILLVRKTLEVLSLGKLSGKHSNLLYIIRKPATA